MRGIHISLFALVLALGSLLASNVVAQDFSFESWSDVTKVCPTCEPPPADTIELSNGDTVEGTVRAINDQFYTLERFGEIRTVPAHEVESVDWKRGDQPSGIDSLDQIVLVNGHVLTGEITVDNERPPYFEIESSFLDQSYTVFKSQIEVVFRDGEEYDFEASMNEVTDSRDE